MTDRLSALRGDSLARDEHLQRMAWSTVQSESAIVQYDRFRRKAALFCNELHEVITPFTDDERWSVVVGRK